MMLRSIAGTPPDRPCASNSSSETSTLGAAQRSAAVAVPVDTSASSRPRAYVEAATWSAVAEESGGRPRKRGGSGWRAAERRPRRCAAPRAACDSRRTALAACARFTRALGDVSISSAEVARPLQREVWQALAQRLIAERRHGVHGVRRDARLVRADDGVALLVARDTRHAFSTQRGLEARVVAGQRHELRPGEQHAVRRLGRCSTSGAWQCWQKYGWSSSAAGL